jgi:hypothetical protein
MRMTYRFTTDRADYTDLSSGRVLQGLPGTPALPVRLASEVFLRCNSRLKDAGCCPPYSLFDPCCGAGYHLGVLGMLHRPHLCEIIAADIDEKAVRAARQNLDILTPSGMERRIGEIEEMIERFGKESHRAALLSAQALRRKLDEPPSQTPLLFRVIQANAFDAPSLQLSLAGARIDLVITDVPYGWHSAWRGANAGGANAGGANAGGANAGGANAGGANAGGANAGGANAGGANAGGANAGGANAGGAQGDPLFALLATLEGLLHPESVVAIISDKGQKAAHPSYRRLERFQVGRRRIEILAAIQQAHYK